MSELDDMAAQMAADQSFKDFFEAVRKALQGWRMKFAAEAELQTLLAEIFDHQLEAAYEREYVLTAQDRPDFYFTELGYVIEVKVEGGVNGHLRQLKRYLNFPTVRGAILIATRPYAVPETITGKPVRIISVGGNRL